MGHKHTCMDCGTLIAEGDFDCEEDLDHDYERCDACAINALAQRIHSGEEDFDLKHEPEFRHYLGLDRDWDWGTIRDKVQDGFLTRAAVEAAVANTVR